MDLPPGGGDPNAGGWRFWSGYTRLRSPGCYGLQVDGTTFSEIIIFSACPSSDPIRQTGRCRGLIMDRSNLSRKMAGSGDGRFGHVVLAWPLQLMDTYLAGPARAVPGCGRNSAHRHGGAGVPSGSRPNG